MSPDIYKDLNRRMNEHYASDEDIATDEEVHYAAAADSRYEMSFKTHKAMARELIQRRADLNHGGRMDKFTEPYVRVGVAIVVRREGKILMGRRKGSHGAGTWALPGGHVELGEEPVQTAFRELQEELGDQCRFDNIHALPSCPYISTMFKEGKHHITLFFETNLLSGEPKVMEPNKCEGWEWVDPDPDNLPTPLFGNLTRVDLRP